jgi:ribonuclease P/MRP protein subunit POP7
VLSQPSYNGFQSVGSLYSPPKYPPLATKSHSDARVQKRPLLHPPIASPHSARSTQKVVYISSNTPFISAVKRVRKLLNAIDKRDTSKADPLGEGKESVSRKGKREAEEVSLKATAKAIEKALNLAIFFQGQEDCRVRIKTGSVGVVDDIIETKRGTKQGESSNTREGHSLKRKRSESDARGKNANTCQATGEPATEMELGDGVEKEELPETQVRKTSMVEILICLRQDSPAISK